MNGSIHPQILDKDLAACLREGMYILVCRGADFLLARVTGVDKSRVDVETGGEMFCLMPGAHVITDVTAVLARRMEAKS